MVTAAPLQAGLLGPETLPLLLIVAGLLLSIAEAMAPGAHFIVLGIALLGAGLLGLVLEPLAGPFVLGVLVLLFGGVALYGYRELSPFTGTSGGRTSDSASLKGRLGRVTERVTPTEGQVKLEDGGFNPLYAARSIDGEIPVGAEVMVVDPGGGNVVTVTPVEEVEDEIDRELARDSDAVEARGGGADAGETGTDGADGAAGSARATSERDDAESEPERT